MSSTTEQVAAPAHVAEQLPGPALGRSATHLDGLDGMRALAVAAVVAYHLDPSWLPGGFLGVDVFFVISGFLITTLLVRERTQRGRIDLRRFWLRRVRRLLPALVVCVGVSVVVARAVHHDLVVQIGRQVAGALTFSTNWVEIAAGSSYFTHTAPVLFMNFWSLAVEEQFYLVWPLAVLALFSGALRLTTSARMRLGLGLTGGLAAVSTVLMAVLLQGDDATRVYYGTDTHLMGLMLGAGLAFAWSSSSGSWLTSRAWLRWRRPALVAAGAGLAVMMWTLTETSPLTFRGGIALASVLTVVLVAGLLPTGQRRQGSTRWGRAMSAAALTWVGRRSYGIYLWHWPVIVIIGQDMRTNPGTFEHVVSRLWCLLVIVAVADLSYRFVEAPIRVWGFRECARLARHGILSPIHRTPRFVAIGSVVVLALTAVVVGTAPDRSDTEIAITAAEDAAPTDPPAPTPTPTSTTSPSAAPAPAPPAAPSPSPTQTTPGNWAMPAGTEIDAFGDSMLVTTKSAMDYYFPGVRQDGKSNRWLRDGLAEVAGRGSDVRRAVVLAFGTNGGIDEAQLAQVLDSLGPDRMVVLVTLHVRADFHDPSNAALAQAAAARPNVIVADWDSAISAQLGLLQSDGVHPTITGAHLFAKTVRSAFAALSEKHTGVAVTLPELPAY